MMAAMTELTYEQFGRRFFEVAVTQERVGSAFASLTGGSFDVGPIPSGPGGVARVWATVEIGEPLITRHVGELITFTVEIVLSIRLVVDLRIDRVRYDVDGLITLPLTVRAAEPLELRIEVVPPRAQDVIVGVASKNLRAEFIRAVGQVDAEIKRFIAKYVADEIEQPEVKQARVIDVAAELGRAFESL